jgi:hypothetical protein
VPSYDDRLDVEDAIQRVFPKADPHGVRLLIERAQAQAGVPFGRRVELACVLLSAGDLKQLRHYLEQAALDPRDVLYWAFDYDDEPPAHMHGFLKPR